MRASVLLAILVAGLPLGDTAAASSSTPSANGRLVVATDDGVASLNPDGSGQWGLRFTAIGQTDPAWAPDGSALAVAGPASGGREVLVMQPDGTGVRQVTSVGSAGHPTWSPDGTQIAFDDGSKIRSVPTSGGRPRSLAHGIQPAWSPSGDTLAFVRPEGDGAVIWLLDLATGAERPVSTAHEYAFNPAWFPDGRRIVFNAEPPGEGAPALWSIEQDGTDETQLTDSPSGDYEPAVSPDGSSLAFLRGGGVWLAAADGTGAHPLPIGNAYILALAWQPIPHPEAGCTETGTEGNDLLVGTDGDDVLCGLGGDDSLVGLGGDDLLDGGAGNDWLGGGLGVDVARGGDGDDQIDLRDGEQDVLHGGPGIDRARVDTRNEGRGNAERRIVDANLAAWHVPTTSHQETTNPAALAVDGRIDDYWSSGGYPSQWLDIDLGRTTQIARVRLITPDLPARVPVLLLGSGPATQGALRLLHAFSGPAAFRQELRFTPRRPWRGIRHVRLLVPASAAPMGWVSWPEVELYATAR
jgi:hypothetical protein